MDRTERQHDAWSYYSPCVRKKKKKKVGMTDEILDIVQERKEAKIENDPEKYKKLNKLIKECIKAREERMHNT